MSTNPNPLVNPLGFFKPKYLTRLKSATTQNKPKTQAQAETQALRGNPKIGKNHGSPQANKKSLSQRVYKLLQTP